RFLQDPDQRGANRPVVERGDRPAGRGLDAETWRQRWQRLQELGGPPWGQPIKSGPAVVEAPKYFHPLVVNGPYADRKANIIGAFGAAPAGLVFIRGSGDKALELVKKLDAEAARAKRFYVAVIFLSGEENHDKLAGALKKLAEKEKIQK